jgi:hypothetical protein
MKRLGLALMMASLVFLLVGQATATIITESSMEIEILSGSINPGEVVTLGYTLLNEAYSDNPPEDIYPIYSLVLDYTDTNIFASIDPTSIQAPVGWGFMLWGPYMVWNMTMDPQTYGAQAGVPLSGFEVSVTLGPNAANPLGHPYQVMWDNPNGFNPQGGGMASTPEPTTLLLIGGGLIAIAGYTRIRKKKREV